MFLMKCSSCSKQLVAPFAVDPVDSALAPFVDEAEAAFIADQYGWAAYIDESSPFMGDVELGFLCPEHKDASVL